MAAECKVRFHFDRIFSTQPVDYGCIKLYQIGDLSCEAGYDGTEHVQCCHEITYIVSGTGEFVGGGARYPVAAGDIFLSPRHDVHSYHSSTRDPLRFFYLGFIFNESSSQFDDFRQLSEMFTRCGTPLLHDHYNLYQHFTLAFNEFMAANPLRERMVQTCLEQILIFTYRSSLNSRSVSYAPRAGHKSAEQIVYDIVSLIDSNVLQIGSLRQISTSMGYSYPYLSQIFSQVTGKPLRQYFCERRFEKAAELMKSNLSVTDVSRMLGYDSIHSFSRAFRRRLGAPPSSYKAT